MFNGVINCLLGNVVHVDGNLAVIYLDVHVEIMENTAYSEYFFSFSNKFDDGKTE